MKRLFLLMISFGFLGAAQIQIAAAANVGYVIEEIKQEFLKNRDDKINVTLASSGKLSVQIRNNAPFSIFLSADMAFAKGLKDDGFSLEEPVVYAQGVLVAFSAEKRDFQQDLMFLKSDEVKKIAIANTKTAPYGKAAKEALENVKIYKEIESKLVYADSISSTFAYALNSADVGFIAKSALKDKKMQKYKENENYIDVPASLYSPIKQGMIILKNYKDDKLTNDFFKFLQSQKAKEIFKKYGYL